MKRKKLVVLSLLGLAGMSGVTGCYTRTVEAKGLGAEWGKQDVYEPNMKASEEGGGLLNGAGDVLFGGRKIEERKK